MEKRVGGISRFFFAARREFAPAVFPKTNLVPIQHTNIYPYSDLFKTKCPFPSVREGLTVEGPERPEGPVIAQNQEV